MKQILQDLRNGDTSLVDIPAPKIKKGYIIVKSSCSLVSKGTEKMLIDFGNSNILQKALSQPEKVKQVFEKIKLDGLEATYKSVNAKLDQVIPLGYSNVGIVTESTVNEFNVGDRVVSNGPHSEIICVPKNLAAKIPDDVSDVQASFTVVGSIALQGIRLLSPTFGEIVAVIGLGLIGQIAIQILKSNGVRVIGIDIDKDKCSIAESFGVETITSKNNSDMIEDILSRTSGYGVDGTIITAANKNNDIISQSAKICRKRGKIVLVGVTGLNLNRDDFYKKELNFQVSCSYGPGRYDDNYEINGNDYPLPYVRWTEKRNFETVLNAISQGQINIKPLVSKIVQLDKFKDVYSSEDSIASIFKYSKNLYSNERTVKINDIISKPSGNTIAILGAGNFCKSQILPEMAKHNINIKYILSESGVNSNQLAEKYNINFNSTDINEILNDNQVESVIISTRHDSHAKYIIKSIKSGKKVFVEKPLGITIKEIEDIAKVYNQNKGASLMIGFNRRFSKHLKYLKSEVGNKLSNISITINAGDIPSNHWVHDPKIGGGRVIGECCHLIDVAVFIAGSMVKSICMNGLQNKTATHNDNVSILIKHVNGANTSINYFSNGSRNFPKERVDVFYSGKILSVDNYKTTTFYQSGRTKVVIKKIDKGWNTQFKEYSDYIKNGGKSLISFEEIINVSLATISAVESLKNKKWVDIVL